MDLRNLVPVVDEGIDAYVAITAAQRRKQREQKLRGEKTASALDIARNVAQSFGRGITSPVGLASLTAAGAGAAASYYGPSWAFGPTDEQIEMGNRWSARRALVSAALAASLVATTARTPRNIQMLLAAKDAQATVMAALRLGGPAGILYSVGKDAVNQETPDLRRAALKGLVWNRIGSLGRFGMLGWNAAAAAEDVLKQKALGEVTLT